MKTLVRSLAVLALTLLVALPLVAQEKKGKKKGKGGDQVPPAVAAVQKQLAGLDLNDEQEGKIKELVTQFSGKLADAQKKAAAVLTPEAQSEEGSRRQGQGRRQEGQGSARPSRPP